MEAKHPYTTKPYKATHQVFQGFKSSKYVQVNFGGYNGILGATEQKHFYISPKEQPANGEAWWWQH